MTRELAEENGKKQSRGRDGRHDRSICCEAFVAGGQSPRSGGGGAVPDKKESMTEAVMLSSH
jgi:hypothetical protein